MSLSKKQRNKLQRIQEVIKMGDLGVAKMILELEEKLEEEIPQIKNIIERLKGDKGDSYVLTDKDKKEIAKLTNSLVDLEDLSKKTSLLIDLNKISEEASKLIKVPKPKDGKTPTEKEIAKIVKKLVPKKDEVVNEFFDKAVDNVVKELNDLFTSDIKELEDNFFKKHNEDINYLEEKIEEIRNKIKNGVPVRNVGLMGIGRQGDRLLLDDFSDQTDGSTKSFYLTKEPLGKISTIKVWGTDFPIILRPIIDFTVSGKLLTLTDEVDAPSSGATLLCEYKI